MNTHAVLRKYLEKKKASSPGFSLRALAKRLELSPSFLSRVMSGEKPVPYPLLMRLKSALDIEAEVFESLKHAHLDFVEDARTPVKGKAQVETALEDWDLASHRTLNVLREWFYLPILEFTTLEGGAGTAEAAAERLGISKLAAEVALRELEHLGLVKSDGERYVKTRKKIRWGSSKSLSEVRRFHDQMLERARIELRKNTDDEAFARRLITGITLTARPEKIEAAKKKLAECLHEIANELTEDPGTDVFHLSAQLFPLTKNTR